MAIAWLMKKKEGEARDALHHHTIGDISIVWGDDKTGFAKIINKHLRLSSEKEQALKRLYLLKRAMKRADEEEVEEAKRLLSGKMIWERP